MVSTDVPDIPTWIRSAERPANCVVSKVRDIGVLALCASTSACICVLVNLAKYCRTISAPVQELIWD